MPPSPLLRERATASPATTLLLSLALLLHAFAGAEPSAFRMTPTQVQAGLEKELELRCEVMVENSQAGCSWLFQERGVASRPRFLMYVTKNRVKPAEDVNPEQMTGKVIQDKRLFSLTLRRFQEHEQGYYFCSIVQNSVIHFSPFVPVFLPAKPTTARPTPRPPTQAPTNATRQVTLRPEVCGPSAGSTGISSMNKRGLDLSCNIYIWAPLAGTCGLLLLSLVTVIIYNHRNRKRVCKCPRPQIRQGGKPNPSERYV